MNDEKKTEWKHSAATTLMFLKSNSITGGLVTTTGDFADEFDEKDYPRDIKWPTCSFILKAEERSKAFADLVNEYFEPASIAMADITDTAILQAMAVGAGNRVGSPGNGIMPVLPRVESYMRLVVGRKAELQMLVGDAAFCMRKPGKRDGTALSEAQIFENVWMDQNCPSVYTSSSGWETQRDIFRVEEQKELGDISLLFHPSFVKVTYCRLKEDENTVIANFAGRLLRMKIEDDGEDTRVTVDTAFRVDVDPSTTTAIFS